MADSSKPSQPSSDRHSKPPKSVRLPGGLEARLDAYTAATGMKANAVMVDAITEYLNNHDTTGDKSNDDG